MKSIIVTAGMGLVLMTGAAMAQDDAQDPARSTSTNETPLQPLHETIESSEEDERGQEVICRTEKVTGSLVRRRRTCMTREEWDEFHRNTYQGLSDFNRSASGAPKCISAADVACGTTGPQGEGF